MAERKPLVIISGVVQELPVGDTLPTSGSVDVSNIVTVWNAGDPQIVFDANADIVTN